jgi:hypothetical protein
LTSSALNALRAIDLRFLEGGVLFAYLTVLDLMNENGLTYYSEDFFEKDEKLYRRM